MQREHRTRTIDTPGKRFLLLCVSNLICLPKSEHHESSRLYHSFLLSMVATDDTQISGHVACLTINWTFIFCHISVSPTTLMVREGDDDVDDDDDDANVS